MRISTCQSILSMLCGRPQCQTIRGAAVARRMASSINIMAAVRLIGSLHLFVYSEAGGAAGRSGGGGLGAAGDGQRGGARARPGGYQGYRSTLF